MSESYHDLLGVSQDATPTEIRQAYRQQVKRHHPDVSDAPDAREKLIRIQEAKEALLDRSPSSNSGASRDQQASASPDSDVGSHRRSQRRWWTRTRANRWTKTERHEREQTASTERVDPTVREQLEWAAGRLKAGASGFARTITHPATAFEWVDWTDRSDRQSPTVVRIAVATIVFVGGIVLFPLLNGSSLDSSTELWLLVGAFVSSYIGYELFSPLFRVGARHRERYKPAGRPRLWPIVGANLVGLCLLGADPYVGPTDGGLEFAVLTVAIALVFFVLVPAAFANGLRTVVGGTDSVATHTTGVGVAMGALLAGGLLFTTAGWITLTGITEAIAAIIGWGTLSATPWIAPFVVGPLRLGLLGNFLIGLVVSCCLLWSVGSMAYRLTTAPWRDRYEHGYRVRPGIWNVLVVVPFALLGWMVVFDHHQVVLPIVEHVVTQGDLLVRIFVLPSVLTGLYLVRRQAEPTLRDRMYDQF